MNPVIVTANRAPTAASNVLADYDYIGPEEIAQAGQTSLVELLQRQRGVEISSYGTGGSIASVFLRGTSNAQSLVLIDGVRTDSGFNGGPSWQAIPLALIDHIEIIFGPQSSLYGADAIGGVVQIFTKQGEGPAKVSISSGYGTYGTTITEASIYGATEGEQKIRYSLSASQICRWDLILSPITILATPLHNPKNPLPEIAFMALYRLIELATVRTALRVEPLKNGCKVKN